MDPSNPIPPRANGGARSPDSALTPLYDRIGALPFATFSERLYARIDSDARIRAMFPADLSPTSESVRDMREFLTQFFGGAQTYSMRKGHPRLRARHLRFPIDQAARDAWLENALAALRDTSEQHNLDQDARERIRVYLVEVSLFMMNRVEPPTT
jgi:hemoglobin